MSSKVCNSNSKPHRLLALSILLICSTFGSTSTHRWASLMSPHSMKSTLFKIKGGSAFPRKRLSVFPKKSKTPQTDSNSEDYSSNTYSREKLYEAYNLLHTLGRDFNLDIQAPSVLVVGHQSSGKSALIEALMGFQFNNVGGGTKTRRPVALHMRYNPSCPEPVCYLTDDDTGKEHRMSLEEIQEHITAENLKLEADPNRCFDHREIVVRVEYRYCPNMVMVDTPGLISGGKSDESNRLSGRFMNNHEKAHQQMVKEAENLVLNKMRSPEYIILCVEDTADWKHATTRSLVERADPTLSRTVIVNTKLDTKLMQFSDASDVQDFIKAPLLKRLHPQLAGGPFFTTVPSGRVGKTSKNEFNTQEAFIRKLRNCERGDEGSIESKVGSFGLNDMEASLGVRRLRNFLEQKVERCYRGNVATIVPVLQAALKRTEEAKMKAKNELKALSADSLKDAANKYREHFSRSVADCIQGTISASPDLFGETLEEEELGGGSFFGSSSSPSSVRHIVDNEVAHATSRLYGGSQYHRSLREFALAVQHRALPEVSSDEIANAAGVNDVHDGTNYMRAACVIAVAKAQDSFSPLLESLQGRARHVMKRLFPIVTHMLDSKGVSVGGKDTASMSASKAALSDAVKEIFADFVELSLSECLKRCDDDLKGMTRFVTWDLQERGSLAVADALPSSEMVHIYAMSMKNKDKLYNGGRHPNMIDKSNNEQDGRRKWRGFRGGGGSASAKRGGETQTIVEDWESYGGLTSTPFTDKGGDEEDEEGYKSSNREHRFGPSAGGGLTTQSMQAREAADVMALMEQVACMRDGNRTSKVVSGLVQHIVKAWQLSFAQNVAMKFNCFYLLPFLDEFPFYLRSRLDKMYDNELSHLFDVSDAKNNLEKQLRDLDEEAAANKKLQAKFEAVNEQLSSLNHKVGEKRSSRKLNSGAHLSMNDSPQIDISSNHILPPVAAAAQISPVHMMGRNSRSSASSKVDIEKIIDDDLEELGDIRSSDEEGEDDQISSGFASLLSNDLEEDAGEWWMAGSEDAFA